MTVFSAESAAEAAVSAPFFWLRLADAPRLTLPSPWVSGPVDKVNGEEAVLIKHPARERAYVRYLDGDPLTLSEALYVRATLER